MLEKSIGGAGTLICMGGGLESQRGPESKKEEYIIVEVGSGGHPYINNPKLSQEYLERFRKDASIYYIATDNSGGALEAGREEFKESTPSHELDKTNRIHFVLALGSQLPFKDESVSEIIFRNVFGNPDVSNTVEMIQEARRVLKPKGIIKIIEQHMPQIATGSMEYLSELKSFERVEDAKETGFVDETTIDQELITGYESGFVARFRKRELAG